MRFNCTYTICSSLSRWKCILWLNIKCRFLIMCQRRCRVWINSKYFYHTENFSFGYLCFFIKTKLIVVLVNMQYEHSFIKYVHGNLSYPHMSYFSQSFQSRLHAFNVDSIIIIPTLSWFAYLSWINHNYSLAIKHRLSKIFICWIIFYCISCLYLFLTIWFYCRFWSSENTP